MTEREKLCVRTKKGMSDRILKMHRIRQVQEWIMEGHLTPDIIKSCVSKWGLKSAMAYKYVNAAREEFKKILIKDVEGSRAFHVATRMKLYNQLENKNKPQSAGIALEILKDIAKLENLTVERIEQKNTNVNVNYNTTLTPEEVREYSKILEDEC